MAEFSFFNFFVVSAAIFGHLIPQSSSLQCFVCVSSETQGCGINLDPSIALNPRYITTCANPRSICGGVYVPATDKNTFQVIRGCLDSCNAPNYNSYFINCCSSDLCNTAINVPTQYLTDNGSPLPTLVPLTTTRNSSPRSISGWLSIAAAFVTCRFVLFF